MREEERREGEGNERRGEERRGEQCEKGRARASSSVLESIFFREREESLQREERLQRERGEFSERESIFFR